MDRVRRITLIASLLCLAPFARAQESSTQPAQSLAQIKADDLREITKQWSQFPTLTPQNLRDVIQFGIDANGLTLQSVLSPGDGESHTLQLFDRPGPAMVRFAAHQTPGAWGGIFEYYDISDPGTKERHLEVLPGPTSLQICQDLEYLDRTQFVTLIIEPGQAKLYVQVETDCDGVQPMNAKFFSPSFASLQKDHPEEVAKYLRPLFRDFGQEKEIFTVENAPAWQIMSDTWHAPADLPGRVDAIIARFSDDSYTVRAAAAAQLAQLGQPAALYLMSKDTRALTPEQQARIQEFLVPYEPLPATAVAHLKNDQWFLLDCLSTSDAALRAATLEHLDRAVGHPIAFDINQTPPQRAAALAQIRQELFPCPSTRP
jgi:hypothetical protein